MRLPLFVIVLVSFAGCAHDAHRKVRRAQLTPSVPGVFWLASPKQPRLDRISLFPSLPSHPTLGGHKVTWEPNHKVSCTLFVQGVNIGDIEHESRVYVNGTPVTTEEYNYSLAGPKLHGVDPLNLDQYIPRHVALTARIWSFDRGETILVKVVNKLGVDETEEREYTLPASPETLDSDGDNIPDEWEINGYDADGDGKPDILLGELGAHPFRPDVFVEVDIMDGLTNPPTRRCWGIVKDAFADAPIISPYEALHGINLHIDIDETDVPWVEWVSINPAPSTANPFDMEFYDIKPLHFDAALRGRVYHYCLWVNRVRGAGGASNARLSKPGVTTQPLGTIGFGNDIVLGWDEKGARFHTPRCQAEMFMHELGHNLGLNHGADDQDFFNPAHNSVMSYLWVWRTTRPVTGPPLPNTPPWWVSRADAPINYAFYYANSNGAAIDTIADFRQLAQEAGTVISFSHGMGRTLDESNLDESFGVYGIPFNWDGDAFPEESGVSTNINIGLSHSSTMLHDYPQWTLLDYRGPELGGRFP